MKMVKINKKANQKNNQKKLMSKVKKNKINLKINTSTLKTILSLNNMPKDSKTVFLKM